MGRSAASARAAEAAASRPVFIVGLPRSGSSILYRLVQEHPSFLPSSGLNLAESQLFDVVVTSPTLEVPSLQGFVGHFGEEFRPIVDDLVSSGIERRRQVALRTPSGGLLRSPLLWSALGCEAAVRVYLWHAMHLRGAPRLVEKSPRHLRWSAHVLRAFPQAQLLAIVRHPVATYASYRRRAAEDADAASWAEVTPERFAATWRGDAERLVWAATTFGDSFRVERYEDLVGDAERTQEHLFAWLGEPARERLPVPVAPNPHAPASDATQLYGTIRDLGRDWRAHAAPDDVDRIQRALATPMSLLGYPPVDVS